MFPAIGIDVSELVAVIDKITDISRLQAPDEAALELDGQNHIRNSFTVGGIGEGGGASVWKRAKNKEYIRHKMHKYGHNRKMIYSGKTRESAIIAKMNRGTSSAGGTTYRWRWTRPADRRKDFDVAGFYQQDGEPEVLRPVLWSKEWLQVMVNRQAEAYARAVDRL